MAVMQMREAIRAAMSEEMDRDDQIFLMGEEVAEYNGAYKVSQGMLDRFGARRVIDTPITEGAFSGLAIGAAMAGMRPIVEWMTFNFGIQALDQVINNAAKTLSMSGGQIGCPIVFRGPSGAAEYLAAQHSQTIEGVLCNTPGLKVISPSTPADAKGLLKSAIRDNNPVMFLEKEMMYALQGDVPDDDDFTIPLGVGDIKRVGTDVTIVGWGSCAYMAREAARLLHADGISAEIVDPRTLQPLDESMIVESVAKTHRCVIAQEAYECASVGEHVAWVVQRDAFDALDAPIELVSSDHVPLPYARSLEIATLPSVEKIVAACRKVLYL